MKMQRSDRSVVIGYHMHDHTLRYQQCSCFSTIIGCFVMKQRSYPKKLNQQFIILKFGVNYFILIIKVEEATNLIAYLYKHLYMMYQNQFVGRELLLNIPMLSVRQRAFILSSSLNYINALILYACFCIRKKLKHRRTASLHQKMSNIIM